MKHLKLTTLAATAAIALAPIAQAETLRHAVGSAGVSGLIDGTEAWPTISRSRPAARPRSRSMPGRC